MISFGARLLCRDEIPDQCALHLALQVNASPFYLLALSQGSCLKAVNFL